MDDWDICKVQALWFIHCAIAGFLMLKNQVVCYCYNMFNLKTLYILQAFLLCCGDSFAGSCEEWFKKSKIKPGPVCMSECVVIPTKMATFSCALDCKKFCSERSIGEQLIFNLTDIYPNLTTAERELVAIEPKKSIIAYRLSHRAEHLCLTIYPSSDTNDESDACRHYVWAGLMFKELGSEFAQKVLNAHENDSKAPEIEKAMDLANNRAGILRAEQLEKNKKYSEDALIEEFIKALGEKQLIVIRPKSLPNERGIK